VAEKPGLAEVTLDGQTLTLRSDWRAGESLFAGTVNGKTVAVRVQVKGEGWRLTHAGADVDLWVRSPRAAELSRHIPDKPPPDLSKYLLSPMPGLVVSIAVAEGEPVKAGQPLAVVEAMKMENVLRAERDGTVGKVLVKAKDSVSADQVLIEFI